MVRPKSKNSECDCKQLLQMRFSNTEAKEFLKSFNFWCFCYLLNVSRKKMTLDFLAKALVYCLAVLATAVQDVVASTPGCPKDLRHTTAMKRHGELCYQFVSDEKYWTDARGYCIQNGGRLVKIDNSETNSFIVNTLNSLWWRNNGVWIGLQDRTREMHFKWTGFSIYENEPGGSWSNWGQGHPGAFFHSVRDCVRMVREGRQWRWHETPCSSLKWHYRFICEYKAALDQGGLQLTLTQNDLRSGNQEKVKSTDLPELTKTSIKVSTDTRPTVAEEQTDIPEAALDQGGLQLTLTQNDLRSGNQEKVKSTDSPELTKTSIKVSTDTRPTVAEEQTEIPVLLEEAAGIFEDEWSDEEEIEPSLESYTTSENNLETQTFYHELVTDVVIIEDFSAIADKMSVEKSEELNETKEKKVRLSLSLVFCFVAAFLFAAFLLYRRRKKDKMTKNDDCDVKQATDKIEKQEPTTRQSTVANIYVIPDFTDSSRVRNKFSEENEQQVISYSYLTTSDDHITGQDSCNEETLEEDDCWTTEYDTPKAVNLYAEISDGGSVNDLEHIYESLDECVAKIEV